MKRPVIAVNTGGPLETVLHGETGFLCEPNQDAFSDAMLRVIKEPGVVKEFGTKGHAHVKNNFSFEAFSRSLDAIVCQLHFFRFDAFPVD